LTAHQCSGGASGRRVRLRAALLRVRISPRTPQARSPTGRGVALRTHTVSVRIRSSLPCSISLVSAPVAPTGRGNRLKSGSGAGSNPAGRTIRPRADGEAGGSQTRFWVFESPRGCHLESMQCAATASGERPGCNLGERGSIPRRRSKFPTWGGVDELLKSPVPKTGVSPERTTEG
jgi:hypothetical protein